MGHGKIEIGSMAFTGSQVPNLYGCGYGTKLGIYNRYKGIFQDEETFTEEAKKSMEFGTFFEDAVARFFAAQMGFKIKKCGETAYWADDMPYFICHPDRLVIGKDSQGRRVALEIKCVSPFSEGWGEPGTQDVPDNYYIQCQCYFACKVPCDVVFLVAMRGNRILSYEITPDEEVIADIRYRVAKTKKDFDEGIIPNPENYEEASILYKNRVDLEAEGVGANDDVLAKYNELLEQHRISAEATEKEKAIKTELMTMLGENPAFVTTDGKKIKKIVYWLEKNTTRFNDERFKQDHPDIDLNSYREPGTSREFRISYPREKKEN